MSGISATTTAPEEVKRLFGEYAGILEMYASDQIGMSRRAKPNSRHYRDCIERSKFYEEIANEMRSIVFTKE